MIRENECSRQLLENFRCSITLELPFIDPIEIFDCGHLFDRASLDSALQAKPNSCPCCRGEVKLKRFPSHIIMFAFKYSLSQHPESYQDVHFNLDYFRIIVQQNKLKDPVGERFLTVLENASNHLNAAMTILASTSAGRDYLRKKLKVADEGGTKKYFLGNAEISAEFQNIQIKGYSIGKWLSITTEREDRIEKARQAATVRARLFALQNTVGLRPYSEAVNPLLQQLVYGEESNVKEKLEAVKNNVAQLSALLEHTGTVQNYSDCTITQMTLLQAAAAAGDLEMCQMLKSYMDTDEFKNQLAELFPDGIKAHVIKQQQDVFNFDSIIAAIDQASDDALDAALSKVGAQFTQTDTARNKSDDQLTLVEALNRFREQFATRSNKEKIFNPYHLLRAYEAFDELWDQGQHGDDNTNDKKIDLCLRQMVGFIQRFVPACYAQAFIQGLLHLVKVENYQNDDWHHKALERTLKFKYNQGAYFSEPLAVAVCDGLGFDFAVDCRAECKPKRWGMSRMQVSLFFKNFCQTKTEGFQSIISPKQSSQKGQ